MGSLRALCGPFRPRGCGHVLALGVKAAHMQCGGVDAGRGAKEYRIKPLRRPDALAPIDRVLWAQYICVQCREGDVGGRIRAVGLAPGSLSDEQRFGLRRHWCQGVYIHHPGTAGEDVQWAAGSAARTFGGRPGPWATLRPRAACWRTRRGHGAAASPPGSTCLKRWHPLPPGLRGGPRSGRCRCTHRSPTARSCTGRHPRPFLALGLA